MDLFHCCDYADDGGIEIEMMPLLKPCYPSSKAVVADNPISPVEYIEYEKLIEKINTGEKINIEIMKWLIEEKSINIEPIIYEAFPVNIPEETCIVEEENNNYSNITGKGKYILQILSIYEVPDVNIPEETYIERMNTAIT